MLGVLDPHCDKTLSLQGIPVCDGVIRLIPALHHRQCFQNWHTRLDFVLNLGAAAFEHRRAGDFALGVGHEAQAVAHGVQLERFCLGSESLAHWGVALQELPGLVVERLVEGLCGSDELNYGVTIIVFRGQNREGLLHHLLVDRSGHETFIGFLLLSLEEEADAGPPADVRQVEKIQKESHRFHF